MNTHVIYQSMLEICVQNLDIVVRKYNQVAFGGGDRTVVAFGQTLGVVDGDDLEAFACEHAAVHLTDRSEAVGVNAADDDRNH